MKKGLVLLLFVTLFTANFAKDIFIYEDKKGDDNGPGTYTYPSEKVFVEGSFDLHVFKIYEEEDYYCFSFEVGADFKNEWKNKNGWDVQMFDVYLNLGEGKHKQTVAGRNVKLKQGWDKVLVVASEKNEKFWEREVLPKNEFVGDDESELENLIPNIKIPSAILIMQNKLIAKIEKNKIKDINKLKYIQVFVSGSEGYPNSQDSYIRTVNEYNSTWRFGGGNDFYGDPNVIDIIGENKQLGNYKSSEDVTVYPMVDMVKVGK